MTRVLAAAALGLGLMLTGAPAAEACEPSRCPWTALFCREFGCPVACYQVADEYVCVL